MHSVGRTVGLSAAIVGAVGLVAGLVRGLTVHASTAWAAAFEVGVPAAAAGAIVGIGIAGVRGAVRRMRGLPFFGNRPQQGLGAADQWAVAAAAVAAAGVLATFAGANELLANRHLPPGWTRYQPPWTVPVFVAGLVLLALATILGVVAVTKSRRQVS